MVLLVTGVAAPAAAQSSNVELGVGYQMTHIPENWNPLGFNVAAAFGTSDNMRIVGEVGMTKDSEDALNIVSATVTDWNFGGGVRFTSGASSSQGYFQVIAGGLHRSLDFDIVGVGVGGSQTKFMLQPGVGFTYGFSETAGLLVDLAFRRVFADEEPENQFRFVIGVQVGR
jgi:hypothetical protein